MSFIALIFKPLVIFVALFILKMSAFLLKLYFPDGKIKEMLLKEI